jgi:hypothetical protein
MRVRSFGKRDACILLAFGALAVLSADRRDREFRRAEADRRAYLKLEQVARRPDWLWRLDWPAMRAKEDLKVFLVVMTLGAGTVVVRRPGLFRKRPWPGPGVVAAMAGAASAVYCGVLILLSFGSTALWARRLHRQWFQTLFEISSSAQEGAIAGVWAFLVVARAWRPHSDDWDDRIGRYLGWAWIGVYTFEIIYPAIWT